MARSKPAIGDKRSREDRVRSRQNLLAMVLAPLTLAALVFLFSSPPRGAKPPDGIQTFPGLSRNHVEGPVRYQQHPPAGGDHAPIWQNCGFYDAPVQNENATHSLEHGAVWISYQQSLADGARANVQRIAAQQTYVLASPMPDLPSAIVASAWGVQLRLDSGDDPRLQHFIQYYRLGPQTPEPGGVCTGGVGQPLRLATSQPG